MNNLKNSLLFATSMLFVWCWSDLTSKQIQDAILPESTTEVSERLVGRGWKEPEIYFELDSMKGDDGKMHYFVAKESSKGVYDADGKLISNN